MKLERFEPKENESRKDFLIRVAIHVIHENADLLSEVYYDDAWCDGYSLVLIQKWKMKTIIN